MIDVTDNQGGAKQGKGKMHRVDLDMHMTGVIGHLWEGSQQGWEGTTFKVMAVSTPIMLTLDPITLFFHTLSEQT